eukprot:XP_015578858.1 uncharacterized protein LOC107261777 [Ricinus communis]
MVMEEMYKGTCRRHMNDIVLTRKIMHPVYYWLMMEKDCEALLRKFCECQLYSDLSDLPPTKLHNLMSLWLFTAWEIYIIREIKPLSNGHKSIVVVIDYFFKWVEAESLITIEVRQIIKRNLICRYGVPYHIVTNNGMPLMGEMTNFLEEYKIKHHRSSPYRPQANGMVEVVNKNLKKVLLKMM